jgi:hypothetical protein
VRGKVSQTELLEYRSRAGKEKKNEASHDENQVAVLGEGEELANGISTVFGPCFF